MRNLPPQDQEEQELIEKYLDGTMASEEMVAFEKRMQVNDALNEKVEQHKKNIKDLETAILKEHLKRFHQKIGPEKEKKKFKTQLFLKYAVAASIIGLITLSGIWYLTKPPAHEKLFANYFTPDPGLITPMSSETEYVFYDAMVDYKRGNYKKALEKWQPLLEQKIDNDTLTYFIGVSHLAMGEAKKALPYLQTSSTFKSSIFLEEAFYYAGMAHLKLGNISEAKAALKKSNFEKSKEVLKKLK